MANPVTLNLENLGQVDAGRAKQLVDEAIALAVSDLDKNGDDGAVRKVAIQLEMWVEGKEKRLIVKAQAKLPPQSTEESKGRTKIDKGRARLMFEDLEIEEEEKPTAAKKDEEQTE